ncbi:iron complex outermembrane recepter protein [Sphingobium faniae]|nr:iron complex outermembrane recepter protein [Sphingobium faniae]
MPHHNMLNGLFASCALAGVATALIPAQSYAQTEPATAQDGRLFGDIIVTARRREEALQDVPVAITALSSESLRERNIQSAGDLVASTPSLQLQPGLEGRQAARFYIRGQGVGFGGAPPSVVTYFAEVPLDPNGGATFALTDMAVAQVLRGPQGTLFGRNANGGAVVLVPKAPGDETDGYIDLSYGNYDYVNAQAGFTLPISDTLSVRLSGQISRRDGYTKNISGPDYDDFDTKNWRIYLRWQPTDAITNDLIYAGSTGKSNGIGTILTAVRGAAALPGIVYPRPGLPLVTGTGLPDDLAFQNAAGPRTIDSPAPYFGEKRRLHLITNMTKIELGDVTIKNIVGYEDIVACPSLPVTATRTNFFVATCFNNYISDNLKMTYPQVDIHPTIEQRQITEELNISGTAFNDRLNWIVGGFLLWSDPKSGWNSFHATRVAKSLFVANVSTALSKDRSQAVYAQGTFNFTDSLSFTAGLRHTWDQRAQQFGQYANSLNGAPGNFACATPGALPTAAPEDCFNIFREKFSDYSYTVGFDFKPSRDLLTYVYHRRGYKSGGFNSTSLSTDPRYAPEILEDVEVGAKYSFNTGLLRGNLNVAYFHAWYAGIQQQLSIVVNNQATVITTNAGKANMDGVEVEGSLQIGERVNLSLAYSHIAASYNKCPADVPVAQLTPRDCFVDSGMDVTSSKFLSTPKDSLNLTAAYSIPLSDGGKITTFLSYYTRSKTAFAADNVLNFESFAPGYEVFNGRIDWKNIGGSQLSLGAFVNNIFDKDYVVSGIGLGGLIGTTSYIYGEPRTYGANLRFEF